MRDLFPGASPDSDLVTLEGVLERITFTNEQTGWSVIRLSVPGRSDLVTVVGSVVGVKVGESLRVVGRWVEDRRYGRQVQAESFVPVLPSTALGIEKYLASGVIPGIGAKTAEKIVAAFGHRALDVLTNEPHLLGTIKGLRKKAAEIADTWARHRSKHEAMVFMQSVGLGIALAARILHTYGPRAVELVKSDPYRLAAEIEGVGFLTADRIAQQIGIPPGSPERAEAGVVHVLREATADGHCFLPLEELERATQALLGPEGAPAAEAAARLADRGAVVVEGDGVWPRLLHEAEVVSAERLRFLLDRPAAGPEMHPERALAWFEERAHIRLAEGQRRAIVAGVRSKVSIITGGPGTGKTTLIRGFTQIFRNKEIRLALCAPTGRAARRMTEATGAPAKTVHRLLEWNPATGRPQRGLDNPLAVEAVIADEASMLDIGLFRNLLEAVPDGARLILVGDADQLPSVGPGSVLRDVIASGAVETTRLTQIFRQDERSLIVTNAHAVLHGEMPQPLGSDFAFVEREDPEKALHSVLDIATRELPKRLGCRPAEVQVLAPMHRGTLGVQNLNAALQERLNPAGAAVLRGRGLRVGDKVMQTVNNYEKEVFNGDLGVILSYDEDEGLAIVDFDGRPVKYRDEDLLEVDLAYACTIHKSQGSEYAAAVVALHTQHFPMLQRNLLYTAITRGKKFVAIVGSKRALGTAIRNDRERMRWTRLAERLRPSRERGVVLERP
jgi:exodeoxyribonuclease V alpha subunit